MWNYELFRKQKKYDNLKNWSEWQIYVKQAVVKHVVLHRASQIFQTFYTFDCLTQALMKPNFKPRLGVDVSAETWWNNLNQDPKM